MVEIVKLKASVNAALFKRSKVFSRYGINFTKNLETIKIVKIIKIICQLLSFNFISQLSSIWINL